MPLKLVRVDDRLIHGQVVAVWLKAIGADRIIVVDDATARDEFLKEVLVTAAPPGTKVEVYGLADGATRVAELAASPFGAFVLMKSPTTALELRRAGVPFDVLNVGGMGSRPGRKRIYKHISAGEQEVAAMRALEEMGTRVEFRVVADDRPVAFASLDQR